MDTRAARRAAEKAARDLINNRATLVGELGVAHAEHAQIATDVAAATERGRQLVAAAEAEAARLLETAQTCVRDAQQRYANVYGAATAAGWAPTDLTALGFPPTDSNTPRRRPRSHEAARATPAAPAPSTPGTTEDVAVPQEHGHTDTRYLSPALG